MPRPQRLPAASVDSAPADCQARLGAFLSHGGLVWKPPRTLLVRLPGRGLGNKQPSVLPQAAAGNFCRPLPLTLSLVNSLFIPHSVSAVFCPYRVRKFREDFWGFFLLHERTACRGSLLLRKLCKMAVRKMDLSLCSLGIVSRGMEQKNGRLDFAEEAAQHCQHLVFYRAGQQDPGQDCPDCCKHSTSGISNGFP